MDATRLTPLQTLSHSLQDMIDTVSSADSDIKSLQDLLTDLKTTLGYPATMDGDLKKIEGPLLTVQKLAADISVLPEIGAPAGAMARAIHPFVLPKPPGGLIGEARSVLQDIDQALSDLKAGLDKIKKPVDDVQEVFDAVLTKLGQFKTGVDNLIRTRGDSPAVNKCAQGLNAIIDTAHTDLTNALVTISQMLSSFFDVGSAIDGVARGIGDFLGAIDGVVTEVTASKAFREMDKALKKIEANFAAVEAAGKTFIKTVLKAFGIDADALENGMKRFENRIEHFAMKPVNDALNTAKAALTGELEKIPAVQAFEGELQTLRDKMTDMRNQVEDGLGDECTKMLTKLS